MLWRGTITTNSILIIIYYQVAFGYEHRLVDVSRKAPSGRTQIKHKVSKGHQLRNSVPKPGLVLTLSINNDGGEVCSQCPIVRHGMRTNHEIGSILY